jgi:alpha-1,3-mannosyltransferase
MVSKKQSNIMDFDVVHIVRIFRPNIGGMETIVEQIANKQSKQGYKVCIITSMYKRKKISNNYLDNNNIKIIRLKNLTLKGFIIPFETPKKIKTKIVHIHGMDIFGDFIPFFISYSKKIISPHGGFFHTNKYSLLKKLYFNTISKLLYNNINSYCISYNDLSLMNKLGTNSIYMGCGYNKREFLSNGGEDVLIFGRIGKNKRVDLAINFSLKYLYKSKINIAGYDEIDLMKSYENNSKIEYLGMIEDSEFNSLLKSSGFFVFLSEYEGLGMSLIEALDLGLRCIVSDIESFRLIKQRINYKDVDKFIFFYNSRNFDLTLFNKWKEEDVLISQRIELKENIADLFSWDKVVKILENEF